MHNLRWKNFPSLFIQADEQGDDGYSEKDKTLGRCRICHEKNNRKRKKNDDGDCVVTMKKKQITLSNFLV